MLPSSKHLTRMISSEPATPKSFTVPLLTGGQDSEADLGSNHNVPSPPSLRMLLSTPSHTVHHYWRKFDNAFMRPVFGGRGFVPYVPGSPTEQNNVNQWHWGRWDRVTRNVPNIHRSCVSGACNRLSPFSFEVCYVLIFSSVF